MNRQPRKRQREDTGQFLMVLAMAILGVTLFVSFRYGQSDLFKALTVIGIVVCLYINKERSIKRQRELLAEEAVKRGTQIDSLKKEISVHKVEVMHLEHRLKELTDLHRAISTVNAVSTRNETYDAVLRAALDLVGADRGSLMLVDRSNSRLVFASAIGLDDRVLSGPAPGINDGVAGWVANNAEPILLTGDLDESTPFEVTTKRIGEINVAMSVPLRLGDNVIGVLNLGSSAHTNKRWFSADEQRFAYLFAEHAAMALDRAWMFNSAATFETENGTGDQEFPNTRPNVRGRVIEN